VKVATSKLTQLGLSEYEAKAYIALLKENPLTAYEVAKSATIPTSKIYEVIKKLENRQMVQAIHGESSRLFVPVSLDDFIYNYRTSLILKLERMLKTADRTILLSIWPTEINLLFDALTHAEERGVSVGIVHYGATSIRIGQTYLHPIEDTIYEKKDARGISLVVDSREALIGKVAGSGTEAIWSMNEGFVMMAEDYLRHDIYFIKTARRFAPLLQERFGKRYEKLMDVYSDEEI
jgi:sugar-specific transcriptional regulator TrmB